MDRLARSVVDLNQIVEEAEVARRLDIDRTTLYRTLARDAAGTGDLA